MSTEMMFASLIIAAATATFVMFPFFRRDPDAPLPTRSKTGRQQRTYETLLTEKQRVLRQIRDLDLDYDMGKMPNAIYASQRVYLIKVYVAIASRLDEIEIELDEKQARVEDAIAAYRQKLD
ncbi:MAG: hypothetical protein JXA10_16280 [Anaerolineae bacterium]|nr:hypothetical protein [Anaerolineae bacterium]